MMKDGTSTKKAIRWIAGATVFAFTVTNTAWAGPERGLPSVPPSGRHNLESLRIPAELGEIESQERSHSKAPFLILIQDAHAVLGAQASIEKLISHLSREYGVRLVALEGGKGKLDPSLLRAFPDEAVKRRVFERYLERGELTGAEMAALFGPGEIEFHGIEDWDLYQDNHLAYLRAVRAREKILERWKQIKSQFDKRRQEIYAPKLNEFHNHVEAFYQEEEPLFEFLKYLVGGTPRTGSASATDGNDGLDEKYPQLSKLFESLKKDASLSNGNVEIAIRKLAESFKARYASRLDPDLSKKFNAAYQAFLSSRMDTGLFLKELVETAARVHVKPRLTPAMKEFLGQFEALSTLKGTRLFDELEAFLRETEANLITSDEEKELARDYRLLWLVRDLARLEWTREEAHSFERERERVFSFFGPDGDILLAPALEFYGIALERERSLLENLEKLLKKTGESSAVVLAGGFHTRGLEAALAAKGYRFAVVLPKMRTVAGKEAYVEVMQGKLSYRDYLRSTFYDAFARHSTLELVKGLNEPDFRRDLKMWRDRTLQDLADGRRTSEAGSHTRYIDLLFKVYHDKFKKSASPVTREELLQAIERELLRFHRGTVSTLADRLAGTFGVLQLPPRPSLTPGLAVRNEILDFFKSGLFPGEMIPLASTGKIQDELDFLAAGADVPQGLEDRPEIRSLAGELRGLGNAAGQLKSEVRSSPEFPPFLKDRISQIAKNLPESVRAEIRNQSVKRAVAKAVANNLNRQELISPIVHRETVPREDPVEVPEVVPAPAPAPVPAPAPTPAPKEEPVPAGRRGEVRSLLEEIEEIKKTIQEDSAKAKDPQLLQRESVKSEDRDVHAEFLETFRYLGIPTDIFEGRREVRGTETDWKVIPGTVRFSKAEEMLFRWILDDLLSNHFRYARPEAGEVSIQIQFFEKSRTTRDASTAGIIAVVTGDNGDGFQIEDKKGPQTEDLIPGLRSVAKDHLAMLDQADLLVSLSPADREGALQGSDALKVAHALYEDYGPATRRQIRSILTDFINTAEPSLAQISRYLFDLPGGIPRTTRVSAAEGNFADSGRGFMLLKAFMDKVPGAKAEIISSSPGYVRIRYEIPISAKMKKDGERRSAASFRTVADRNYKTYQRRKKEIETRPGRKLEIKYKEQYFRPEVRALSARPEARGDAEGVIYLVNRSVTFAFELHDDGHAVISINGVERFNGILSTGGIIRFGRSFDKEKHLGPNNIPIPPDIPEDLRSQISRVQIKLLYMGPGRRWRFSNAEGKATDPLLYRGEKIGPSLEWHRIYSLADIQSFWRGGIEVFEALVLLYQKAGVLGQDEKIIPGAARPDLSRLHKELAGAKADMKPGDIELFRRQSDFFKEARPVLLRMKAIFDQLTQILSEPPQEEPGDGKEVIPEPKAGAGVQIQNLPDLIEEPAPPAVEQPAKKSRRFFWPLVISALVLGIGGLTLFLVLKFSKGPEPKKDVKQPPAVPLRPEVRAGEVDRRAFLKTVASTFISGGVDLGSVGQMLRQGAATAQSSNELTPEVWAVLNKARALTVGEMMIAPKLALLKRRFGGLFQGAEQRESQKVLDLVNNKGEIEINARIDQGAESEELYRLLEEHQETVEEVYRGVGSLSQKERAKIPGKDEKELVQRIDEWAGRGREIKERGLEPLVQRKLRFEFQINTLENLHRGMESKEKALFGNADQYYDIAQQIQFSQGEIHKIDSFLKSSLQSIPSNPKSSRAEVRGLGETFQAFKMYWRFRRFGMNFFDARKTVAGLRKLNEGKELDSLVDPFSKKEIITYLGQNDPKNNVPAFQRLIAGLSALGGIKPDVGSLFFRDLMYRMIGDRAQVANDIADFIEELRKSETAAELDREFLIGRINSLLEAESLERRKNVFNVFEELGQYLKKVGSGSLPALERFKARTLEEIKRGRAERVMAQVADPSIAVKPILSGQVLEKFRIEAGPSWDSRKGRMRSPPLNEEERKRIQEKAQFILSQTSDLGLEDLLRVGPRKPLGYLVLPDIRRKLRGTGIGLSDFVEALHSKEGIGTISFEAPDGGRLHIYDSKAFTSFLAEKVSDSSSLTIGWILEQSGIPVDPEEFTIFVVFHSVNFQQFPHAFFAIARAFDNPLFGGSRPEVRSQEAEDPAVIEKDVKAFLDETAPVVNGFRGAKERLKKQIEQVKKFGEKDGPSYSVLPQTVEEAAQDLRKIRSIHDASVGFKERVRGLNQRIADAEWAARDAALEMLYTLYPNRYDWPYEAEELIPILQEARDKTSGFWAWWQGTKNKLDVHLQKLEKLKGLRKKLSDPESSLPYPDSIRYSFQDLFSDLVSEVGWAASRFERARQTPQVREQETARPIQELLTPEVLETLNETYYEQVIKPTVQSYVDDRYIPAEEWQAQENEFRDFVVNVVLRESLIEREQWGQISYKPSLLAELQKFNSHLRKLIQQRYSGGNEGYRAFLQVLFYQPKPDLFHRAHQVLEAFFQETSGILNDYNKQRIQTSLAEMPTQTTLPKLNYQDLKNWDIAKWLVLKNSPVIQARMGKEKLDALEKELLKTLLIQLFEVQGESFDQTGIVSQIRALEEPTSIPSLYLIALQGEHTGAHAMHEIRELFRIPRFAEAYRRAYRDQPSLLALADEILKVELDPMAAEYGFNDVAAWKIPVADSFVAENIRNPATPKMKSYGLQAVNRRKVLPQAEQAAWELAESEMAKKTPDSETVRELLTLYEGRSRNFSKEHDIARFFQLVRRFGGGAELRQVKERYRGMKDYIRFHLQGPNNEGRLAEATARLNQMERLAKEVFETLPVIQNSPSNIKFEMTLTNYALTFGLLERPRTQDSLVFLAAQYGTRMNFDEAYDFEEIVSQLIREDPDRKYLIILFHRSFGLDDPARKKEKQNADDILKQAQERARKEQEKLRRLEGELNSLKAQGKDSSDQAYQQAARRLDYHQKDLEGKNGGLVQVIKVFSRASRLGFKPYTFAFLVASVEDRLTELPHIARIFGWPAGKKDSLGQVLARLADLDYVPNRQERARIYGEHFKVLKEVALLDQLLEGEDERNEIYGRLAEGVSNAALSDFDVRIKEARYQTYDRLIDQPLNRSIPLDFSPEIQNAFLWQKTHKDEAFRKILRLRIEEGAAAAEAAVRALPGNKKFSKKTGWLDGPGEKTLTAEPVANIQKEYERVMREQEQEIQDQLTLFRESTGVTLSFERSTDVLETVDRLEKALAKFREEHADMRENPNLLHLSQLIQNIRSVQMNIESLLPQEVTFYVSQDPIERLNLGVGFTSCLNCVEGAFRRYANSSTLDSNKRVIFVRDKQGRRIARLTLMHGENEIVVSSRFYRSTNLDLTAHLADYLKAYAEAAGKPVLLKKGEQVNGAYRGVFVPDEEAIFKEKGFAFQEDQRVVKIAYNVSEGFYTDFTGGVDLAMREGERESLGQIIRYRKGESADLTVNSYYQFTPPPKPEVRNDLDKFNYQELIPRVDAAMRVIIEKIAASGSQTIVFTGASGFLNRVLFEKNWKQFHDSKGLPAPEINLIHIPSNLNQELNIGGAYFETVSKRRQVWLKAIGVSDPESYARFVNSNPVILDDHSSGGDKYGDWSMLMRFVQHAAEHPEYLNKPNESVTGSSSGPMPVWYQEALQARSPVQFAYLAQNARYDDITRTVGSAGRAAWVGTNDPDVFSFLRVLATELSDQIKAAGLGDKNIMDADAHTILSSALSGRLREIMTTISSSRREVRGWIGEKTEDGFVYNSVETDGTSPHKFVWHEYTKEDFPPPASANDDIRTPRLYYRVVSPAALDELSSLTRQIAAKDSVPIQFKYLAPTAPHFDEHFQGQDATDFTQFVIKFDNLADAKKFDRILVAHLDEKVKRNLIDTETDGINGFRTESGGQFRIGLREYSSKGPEHFEKIWRAEVRASSRQKTALAEMFELAFHADLNAEEFGHFLVAASVGFQDWKENEQQKTAVEKFFKGIGLGTKDKKDEAHQMALKIAGELKPHREKDSLKEMKMTYEAFFPDEVLIQDAQRLKQRLEAASREHVLEFAELLAAIASRFSEQYTSLYNAIYFAAMEMDRFDLVLRAASHLQRLIESEAALSDLAIQQRYQAMLRPRRAPEKWEPYANHLKIRRALLIPSRFMALSILEEEIAFVQLIDIGLESGRRNQKDLLEYLKLLQEKQTDIRKVSAFPWFWAFEDEAYQQIDEKFLSHLAHDESFDPKPLDTGGIEDQAYSMARSLLTESILEIAGKHGQPNVLDLKRKIFTKSPAFDDPRVREVFDRFKEKLEAQRASPFRKTMPLWSWMSPSVRREVRTSEFRPGMRGPAVFDFEKIPERLRPLFTPELNNFFEANPLMRPVYLVVLNETNGEVGPFIPGHETALTEIGGTGFLETLTGFSAGSEEEALLFLDQGRRLFVAAADNFNQVNQIGTLRDYGPNNRQVYIPLKDGTFLGIKGVGQMSHPEKDSVSAKVGVFNSLWGLASEEEAQIANHASKNSLINSMPFAQHLGYRLLHKIPWHGASTIDLKAHFPIKWSAALTFNRFISPYRASAWESLAKDPEFLHRAMLGAWRNAHLIQNLPTPQGTPPLQDLIFWMAEMWGEAEGRKLSAGFQKETLNSQDMAFAQEGDIEELEELQGDVKAAKGENRYGMSLSLKLNILEDLSKLETPFDRDQLKNAALGLFKGYFRWISDDELRWWSSESPWQTKFNPIVSYLKELGLDTIQFS